MCLEYRLHGVIAGKVAVAALAAAVHVQALPRQCSNCLSGLSKSGQLHPLPRHADLECSGAVIMISGLQSKQVNFTQLC